ncbi:hypothetical protein [Pseudarthrobacter sp. B4EP4b]|uniref:hypothetical protein n=1 Tax=Pseudarthrobacter sp. B4EP4b TaxID=2590664 RepID=UPI00114F4AEC|nr:hypothetical protein [Pseudarthrobacter sp. B4EP4b]
MHAFKKAGATLALTGSMLLAGGALAGPASAAPQLIGQNGLVNVAVGDITILEDVNVGVAATVAANICGVKVGPVAVLGTAVDASGTTRTVCTNNGAPVTISQA